MQYYNNNAILSADINNDVVAHVLGLKLSCLCWKDGEGVTASSADWFTLAAISCQRETLAIIDFKMH